MCSIRTQLQINLSDDDSESLASKGILLTPPTATLSEE